MPIKDGTTFILKELRLARKLSRQELAKASGVNEFTIQALEDGRNDPNNAKLSTLINLAKALNCRVRDFYPDEKHI